MSVQNIGPLNYGRYLSRERTVGPRLVLVDRQRRPRGTDAVTARSTLCPINRLPPNDAVNMSRVARCPHRYIDVRLNAVSEMPA